MRQKHEANSLPAFTIADFRTFDALHKPDSSEGRTLLASAEDTNEHNGGCGRMRIVERPAIWMPQGTTAYHFSYTT
jgi:hypothetical protein